MVKWEVLKKLVEENSKLGLNNVNFEEIVFTGALQYMFEKLMEYQLRLDDLFNIGCGVIAASGLFRMSLNIMNETNEKITKESVIIVKILYYLLNPKGLRYSAEELQNQFDYPSVDIDQIDIDWM
jgi:hypothetical protein